MIKNIFLPEHLNGYYFFSQSIIGLSIDNNGIRAAKAVVRGSGFSIENFFSEPLGFSPEQEPDESISIALKNILKKTGSYNQIRLAAPRDKVIFKELTFPFLETSKVGMVLGYELEPMIPFPLEQAVFFFFFTKKDVEAKQLTVMAAIIQKKDISHLLTLLTQAGVNPQNITVDSFSLYSFMQQIPVYKKSTESTVLIDLGYNETTLLYVVQGQLRLVRTINKGLLEIGSQSDLEVALRYDKDDAEEKETEENKGLLNKINKFFSDIAFTMSSFQSQESDARSIDKVILTGEAAELNHLVEFSSHKLSLACELFNTKELQKHKSFSVKKNGNGIPQTYVPTSAIACPTEIIREFNFLSSFFKTSNKTTITGQLIATLVLLCLVFGSFFTYYYMQYNSLSSIIKKSTAELNRTMKKTFDIQKKGSPATLVANAKKKVAEEESLWFAFSKQTRFSFLAYLQELSIRIDRQSLGIHFKKLTMTDEKITLEGQVTGHGFKSILLLEESLKESPLLSQVTIPEELEKYERKTNTTTFIVNIDIPKEGKG